MPGFRFFVELPVIAHANSTVELTAEDSHHARDVLRLDIDDEITVIGKGSGTGFHASIIALEPQVTARITGPAPAAAQSSRVCQLLFALCKGDRNDLVCEKATELGVGTIHFFTAERSIAKMSGPDLEKKRARWLKIAEGASKQCNRESVPTILTSPTLKEALACSQISSGDRLFFCSLTSGSLAFKDVVPPASFVHLTIGPEGNFTAEEESLLHARGFEPLSLGPTVLRSETAAIAAVSMALGVWGYSP